MNPARLGKGGLGGPTGVGRSPSKAARRAWSAESGVWLSMYLWTGLADKRHGLGRSPSGLERHDQGVRAFLEAQGDED
jgi:hypothetical protein